MKNIMKKKNGEVQLWQYCVNWMVDICVEIVYTPQKHDNVNGDRWNKDMGINIRKKVFYVHFVKNC